MSFKKHIMMGMATGLVGMALISGGTVAYFNDSIGTQNQVMSGTLDLGIKNVADKDGFHFNFKDKKPGEKFGYTFELKNDGSLNIGKLTLLSSYNAKNEKGETTDFGSQIKITQLKVNGVINNDLAGKTLHQIDSKENAGIDPTVLITELAPGKEVNIEVEFEFIEEGDQNKYQGNSLNLAWTFDAMQGLVDK